MKRAAAVVEARGVERHIAAGQFHAVLRSAHEREFVRA